MTHAVLRGNGRVLVSTLALAAFAVAGSVAGQAQEQEIQITPQKVESKPAPAAAPAPAAPAAKPTAASTPAFPAPGSAPPPGGVKPDGTAKSAWVKLCEKAPIVKKGDDGKEVKEEKTLCLTHHERLDGNTGMVLVSAAIRQVDGQDKKSIMVMVPLGMAIPPGVRAAVYSKDQWAAASKNEKVDDKALKPFDLKYTLCHPAGCTAEAEATADVLDQMSKGGGMMILAVNAAAQPIGFPVPLDGYSEAANGPPVDNQKYAAARGALMKQIRERQTQLAEKFREEQKKKGAAGGAPTTTGSTEGKAPAAKAPEKK